MKIERWNGEASLEILTDQIQIDGNFDLTTESRTKDKNFELGVEELHVTLNNRPRMDRFAFPIEMKNLVSHFQLPLTTQEITEGCERPKRIVNSYALYHKYRRGNEYKAGKFGQFLRLDIHDDAGIKEWCPYRIESGLLTAEPPSRFLDRARFPVTIGELTFGKTDIGGSDQLVCDGAYSERLVGSVFTCPTTGTADSVTAALKRASASSADEVRGALYLHSDSSKVDETPLSTPSLTTSYDWFTFTFTSPPSISAIDYVPIVWADYSDANIHIAYDAGDTDQGHLDPWWGLPETALPDPAEFNHSTNANSIYVTYTAAAVEVEAEPFIQALTRGGQARSRLDFRRTLGLG